MYADDLCLLADSPEDMQVMLRVLDQYCRDWQFRPAYAKTKVMYFGKCKKTPLHLPSVHGMEKEAGGGEADACVAPLGCECGREPDMVCGKCADYWDGGVIMEAAEYTSRGTVHKKQIIH